MFATGRLVLVDAYSLIYQVYHAIRAGMSGPSGQPTHAVFGIFRDLLRIRDRLKPDYVAAAFDGQGPVFRNQIAADYKAQRGPMPDDLIAQMPTLERLFNAFRFPILRVEAMEADDIIATLARRASLDGIEVLICTADKDARQLLDDRVRIYNMRKHVEYDVQSLYDDWGIRPDQVVDLLALSGDTVDNVAGVPGIGVKTAAQLLQRFETLDNVLANIDQISGAKRKENLNAYGEQARTARALVVLRDDLPLTVTWDDLALAEPDLAELKAICLECGFHRFLQEVTAMGPAQSEASDVVTEVQCITTPEALDALIARLIHAKRICLDTETDGLDPIHARLVGVALCWEPGQAAYIPVAGPLGEPVLPRDQVIDSLRPLLNDPALVKIGQNLKFDLLVLQQEGLELSGPLIDTMLISYLLESGERNHNLSDLALRLLNHQMIPITDLIGKGKQQTTMDQVPIEQVADYAGEDVDVTLRVEQILGPQLRDTGLDSLYDDLEQPLIGVLARMERHGVRVDTAQLRQLAHGFADRLNELEGEIYDLAGRPFNINSGPQLRRILFEELKLPSRQKTPGGEPSTAHEVLEELAAEHDLPSRLIEHRQLAKLKNTYVDALPNLISPRDQRIHTSFQQAVTATGRLSTTDPNLQNIPIRTEQGRQIRRAFVPRAEGWSLLWADYSQIELRILAHFSQDDRLCSAFRDDQDIHRAVAAQIFQVDPSDVQPDQRRMAKTVNFGVLYGLSPYGLAGRLGIPKEDAERFIQAYFRDYQGVAALIQSLLERAQTDGFVSTLLGRRRAIRGIKSTTGITRNQAERTAVNTVIQGTAADMIKTAMIRIDKELQRRGLRSAMVLQIHDELLFDVPNDEIHDLASLVEDRMSRALPLNVPIRVDLKVGPNWLDGQPIEVPSAH